MMQRFTFYSEAQQYAESLAQKAKDKISIVIPFFNRIPTLLEAIKSVLSQSYSNIEVLLIDDGSTDDITPLKELEDSRLRYIYQEHKGTSAARNLGIGLSSGEYIAFLDSDDVFLPGFSGKVFPRILASCGIATSTVMVKREVLNNMSFKESIILGEDVCLWIDIAYSYTVGSIDEPPTSVRIGSTSSVFNIEKQRIAYLNIVDHIIKNPLYIVNEHEIHLLLKDFTHLFKL